MTLPPSLGAVAAWSLLLAYVATGSSVIGGFYHYANLLSTTPAARHFRRCSRDSGHRLSVWIAWRDVKISARLMLWIEAVSVALILIAGRARAASATASISTKQLHLTA